MASNILLFNKAPAHRNAIQHFRLNYLLCTCPSSTFDTLSKAESSGSSPITNPWCIRTLTDIRQVQIRHLDFISQFTTDIHHVKGADNPAADALSRIGANALHQEQAPVIDFEKMAKAQREDSELRKLPSPSSSLTLEDIPLPTSDATICDRK